MQCSPANNISDFRILRVSAEVLTGRWTAYQAWVNSDNGAAHMQRACLGPSPFPRLWECAVVRRDLAAAAARLAPLAGRQAALEAELFAADALLEDERIQAAAVLDQLRASTAEAHWVKRQQREAEARAANVLGELQAADRRARAAEAELAALRTECDDVRRVLRAERRAHELCAAEYSRLRAAT